MHIGELLDDDMGFQLRLLLRRTWQMRAGYTGALATNLSQICHHILLLTYIITLVTSCPFSNLRGAKIKMTYCSSITALGQ